MPSNLEYHHLRDCRVVVGGASGVDQPPVRLPQSCLDAAKSQRLPTLYDFETERKVLEEHEERKAAMQGNDDASELKRSVLVKMKSVTNAGEDICISILENNRYNLDTSVEAFFAGDFKD